MIDSTVSGPGKTAVAEEHFRNSRAGLVGTSNTQVRRLLLTSGDQAMASGAPAKYRGRLNCGDPSDFRPARTNHTFKHLHAAEGVFDKADAHANLRITQSVYALRPTE